jgi:hypothetical protein
LGIASGIVGCAARGDGDKSGVKIADRLANGARVLGFFGEQMGNHIRLFGDFLFKKSHSIHSFDSAI